MTNEKEQLARNLKNYRKENGINQFEFAEDCGISLETIGRIERGTMKQNQEVMVCDYHGKHEPYKAKIVNIYQIDGLGKTAVYRLRCGQRQPRAYLHHKMRHIS